MIARCKPAVFFFAVMVPVIAVFSPSELPATPEYARETGFDCRVCHINPAGGGELTEAGNRFLRSLKARGEYHSPPLVKRIVHLLIGYLHLMAAILWFGTIMYVHLLLKPAYASKGLPKGEMKVGWLSMAILLVTGTLLTFARISSFQDLYTTKFGILLSIKIILFLVMLSSAVVVGLFIGPRLRRKTGSPVADLFSKSMTGDQLAHFDGREGRPAFIAYKGIVYDVTQGRLWKNGIHAAKHHAGTDLTEMLKNAPHGEEKILAMPQAGALTLAQDGQKQPFPIRLFYFFAHMNLVLVFVITFIVALWRWW